MKILIVTQYFYPEQFLINDFALSLQDRGHEISVLTGMPNYPSGSFNEGYSYKGPYQEDWNGIRIQRTPHLPRFKSSSLGLILNYISFTLSSILRAAFFKKDFDLILVYEPSPIFIGLPAIVLKWRFRKKIYFWVQDLWPETLKYSGGLNNKLILKLVGNVTKFIYSQTDIIMGQSTGFVSYIEAQGVQKSKLRYLPNYVESDLSGTKSDVEVERTMPGNFRITFAGNIGESQDFDTLLKACKFLKDRNIDVTWIILGDGRKKEYVEQKIQELGIQDSFLLLGRYPKEMMPNFFHYSDALIVSLKRNPIFSLTIPSKLQAYLASGKPIIGSIDGVGQEIIKEARCGVCADSEKPEELADVIQELHGYSEHEREEMGGYARRYFLEKFSKQKVLNKFEQIIQENL